MRVISRARFRAFWTMAGHQDSERPLRAWYTHVSNRTVDWRSWSDVKQMFATASLVGSCVVFNIGGNKYRLITRVLYPSHKVLILAVLTHAEYDRAVWKDECGCHQSAPGRLRK